MSQLTNVSSTVPCIWGVTCVHQASFTHVIMTHTLLFPENRTFDFDAQKICPPDAEAGDDDRMMMEAFLALIPSDSLVSCAIETSKRRFLLFQQFYYQHVFARDDKNIVADTFEDRLHNTGGGIDFLFAGGDSAAHPTEQITYWSQRLEQVLNRYDEATWIETVEQLLRHYTRVLYAHDTYVCALISYDPVTVAEIRSTLSAVAARYGLVLPEDKFPIERSADNDRANTS